MGTADVGAGEGPVGSAPLLAALRRSPFFAGLDDDALLPLASGASQVGRAIRCPVFLLGEPAAHVWLVIEGRVRLSRPGRGERRVTLSYREAGDLVGEEGVFGSTCRSEATVVEALRAIEMPCEKLRFLARHEPSFALALAEAQARACWVFEGRLHALLTRTVESRVAEFLADAADRHGVPQPLGLRIGLKLTHQEIAEYVGSTRETVTLALGDLRRRGLLATEGRRLIVTDVAAVRALR